MSRKESKYPWKGILLTMAALLFSGWTADSILNFVRHYIFPVIPEKFNNVYTHALTITMLCLCLFVILILIYKYKNTFNKIKTINKEDKVSPKKALIVPISEMGNVKVKEEDGKIIFKIIRKGSKEEPETPSFCSNPENIEEDIEKLEGTRWSWQQLLRGIKPHLNTLEYICIIGSKDKSFQDAERAKKLIAQYLPDRDCHCEIETAKADFEDLDDMKKKIRKAMEKAKKNNIREKDIIVDVTAGKKPVSIAGALVTLSHNIHFQYVQTGDKNGLLSYNVIIENKSNI